MRDKILKAVMERYGGLSTLKLAMWEDDEIEENEILTIIKDLLS